jgi:hypothetical protein
MRWHRECSPEHTRSRSASRIQGRSQSVERSRSVAGPSTTSSPEVVCEFMYVCVSERVDVARVTPSICVNVYTHRIHILRIYKHTSSCSPNSASFFLRTSRRSSLWLPPINSPIPGTSKSMAATCRQCRCTCVDLYLKQHVYICV